jgi:uncharacterized membrane protein YsdA (DUF1294 family)
MTENDIFLLYLIFISIVAIVVTVVDKRNAKLKKKRVPEAALLLIGALGGAIAMYFTMKRIRHKTQKSKFMIGLPAIFACEAALFFFIFRITGQLS